MNANSEIQTLQKERELTLNRANAIGDLARDADRELTEEEIAQQAAYLDAVERIDKRTVVAERLESLSLERAKPVEVVDEDDADTPSGVTVGEKTHRPGELITLRSLALYRNRGDHHQAAEYARSEWNDPLLAKILETPDHQLERAATAMGMASVTGWASEMVAYTRAAEEFIDLLRAQSALAQITTRMLSFAGLDSIIVPRMTTGVSGGWLAAEGDAIPVQAEAFDELTLTPKQVACIVALSRNLAERSSPSMLQVVADDLLRGLSTTIDTRFLSDTGAVGGAPAGIFNGGGTAAGASAGTPRDDIATDLLAAKSSLASALIPKPWVWVMNSAQALELQFVRDANGQYLYRDEVTAGSLMGDRIVISDNQVARDVGLIAADQVLYATGGFPNVDISDQATLQLDDAPASDLDGVAHSNLWQLNALAQRCIFTVDWLKRHNAASYQIQTTNWS